MLARSAQGIYWMGRYLERTQHLSRLLRLQTEALVDSPIREIHFGWMRIYNSIGRHPPLGDIEISSSDDYALADSYTLADDLTFERGNPNSVWNCFAYGRENARQMRQYISSDMWSRLNLAYLRVKDMGIQDIWSTAPEGFYRDMVAEIDTFTGVAAATMYRDERWQFMRLGSFIERSQLLCTLLLTQIDLGESNEEFSGEDWTSLLRMYNAFEAYARRYSVEIEPSRVLCILATDKLLPGSLIRSLERTATQLADVDDSPNEGSKEDARGLSKRLASILHDEWREQDDYKAVLHRVDSRCRELHHLINDTYFEYSHYGDGKARS